MPRPGVPTQISARSVACTASTVESVARNRPEKTTSASKSPSPGSTMGERAALIISTLSRLRSTPTTSCPAFARHALVTQPTYPSPNTLTRMTDSSPMKYGDTLAVNAIGSSSCRTSCGSACKNAAGNTTTSRCPAPITAQHVAHALEPRLVDRLRGVELDDAGDAAHDRRYAAFEPRMRIGPSKSSMSRKPLD